jgi:hypothetical protein
MSRRFSLHRRFGLVVGGGLSRVSKVKFSRVTINVPVVFMAWYILILRRAISITRAIGGP